MAPQWVVRSVDKMAGLKVDLLVRSLAVPKAASMVESMAEHWVASMAGKMAASTAEL